jgi:hypothetical protein
VEICAKSVKIRVSFLIAIYAEYQSFRLAAKRITIPLAFSHTWPAASQTTASRRAFFDNQSPGRIFAHTRHEYH